MTLVVSERAQGVVRFSVRVVPRASATAVTGVTDGALKVRLAAPPVDGAANEALVAFLAESLGLRSRAVALVSGHTSRLKVVEVTGATPAQVRLLGEGTR